MAVGCWRLANLILAPPPALCRGCKGFFGTHGHGEDQQRLGVCLAA